MSEDADAPVRRRTAVAYDPKLAQALCARVAAGEVLYTLCRQPGMPTSQSVRMWTKKHADFREALMAARKAGGRTVRGGGVWTYTPEIADEVFDRLCDGEALSAIGDPAMPCLSTLFYWRRRFPDFETLVQTAKRIQAERFCDLGWEIASAVTPADAYATDVKLRHLRWTAGTLSPARYGRHKLVEAEATLELEAAAPAATPAQTEVIFTVRHFKAEEQPDGTKKVVAYLRDSRTGLLRREHPEDGEDNTPTKDAGPGEWLAG